MKLIINQNSLSTLANIAVSPELKMLLQEVESVFDIKGKPVTADVMAFETKDIIRKNWSIVAVGEDMVLEINDEFINEYAKFASGLYITMSRLVRPIKAVLDVFMNMNQLTTQFNQKLAELIEDTGAAKEPVLKVVPTTRIDEVNVHPENVAQEP